MSQRERDRLKVMDLVLKGQRTQVEAARLLELTVRQIRRIQRRLEKDKDRGVIHRLRGRPSNRRIDPRQRRQVIDAYKAELTGFGPTFAAEKLAERGLPVAVRTLGEWLLTGLRSDGPVPAPSTTTKKPIDTTASLFKPALGGQPLRPVQRMCSRQAESKSTTSSPNLRAPRC